MLTLRLTCTLIAAIALTACATSSSSSITPIADADLPAMPPVTATVESKSPCSAILSAPGGRRFHIGGPDADIAIVNFVSTLEVGKSYRLPDDYLRHQNQ